MSRTNESRLYLAVNGRELTGHKKRGKWTFICADFPGIPREFNGARDTAGVITAFMNLALAGAVKIKELAVESARK